MAVGNGEVVHQVTTSTPVGEALAAPTSLCPRGIVATAFTVDSPPDHRAPDPGAPDQRVPIASPAPPPPVIHPAAPPTDAAPRVDVQQPPPARPRRIIQLGIDYGTSTSKLVFRDASSRLEQKSFLVRPYGRDGDFRVPALVVWENDRLYFGDEAWLRAQVPRARVYPSLKIRAAFPSDAYFQADTHPPEGISVADLAMLSVLHLIQLGGRAIEEYAASLDFDPRLTMTMGVPVASLASGDPLNSYWLMIARARWLYQKGTPQLANGVPISTAREMAVSSASAVGQSRPNEVAQWLLPEAAASLMWAFQSPRVPPGLYASVDVGAGSTDACFFRIVEEFDRHFQIWRKAKFSFWGAAARPPGADALDRLIAKAHGLPNQLEVRGFEDVFLAKRMPKDVRPLLESIYEVLSDAFKAAYPKDAKLSNWQDCRLFLVGGGCRISAIKRHFTGNVLRKNALKPFEVVDPGIPSDLEGIDDLDDLGLALVAYGLSYGLDFATFELPEAVDPVDYSDRRRRRLEEDELPPHVLRDQ